MSGGRKGKWGIAVAALVVVAALLVAGWLHRSQPQEVAASLPSPAPAPHVSEEAHIRVPRGATSAAKLSIDAPTADPSSNADVCGIQKVRPAGANAEDLDGGVIEATQETHDRWKAALLESSDTRAGAVGLLLQRFESLREGSAVQAEESRDELGSTGGRGRPPPSGRSSVRSGAIARLML